MTREIRNYRASVTPFEVPDNVDLQTWLTSLSNGESAWLLAHADDGVIWGKVENGVLTTAYEAGFYTVSPALNIATLQQARIFNENAEWLLWRDGTTGNLCGRQIAETPDGTDYLRAFDEAHMLWGDSVEHAANDFLLMRDGAQGLFHAVPLTEKKHGGRSLRLGVRHYLKEDDFGFVGVAASRLVSVYEE